MILFELKADISTFAVLQHLIEAQLEILLVWMAMHNL